MECKNGISGEKISLLPRFKLVKGASCEIQEVVLLLTGNHVPFRLEAN